MSEQIENTPILSEKSLVFTADHLHTTPDKLVVHPVSGGFSLNRRAIVEAEGESVFVKEVDSSLVEGDGQQERAWLAKDQGITELLRSENIDVVSEWSILSPDSAVLILPAYKKEDGWHWSLPDDPDVAQKYVAAVVHASKQLESAVFDAQDVARLSLQPYFRDKIAGHADLAVLANQETRTEIKARYLSAAEVAPTTYMQEVLNTMALTVTDQSVVEGIAGAAVQLKDQPNDVFGHCDLRTDNLAYHAGLDKAVFVDWNWASQTPANFGPTEFLISVAGHGIDISPWREHLNKPLLGALIGFWLKGCLEPELGETGKLREHQLRSAAVAYDLLQKAN